jgi:rubrerythrin
MKNGKYFIVLFCNKKRVKILYRCMKRTTVTEYWHEFKTERKPPFVKLQGGKRKQEQIFELGLVFPNNRWATKTYVKDSLGRNIEAKIEGDTYRIKEMIPYWKEELIYDFQTKKRIRYHEMIKQLDVITEIAHIFTLNKNIFVQIENDIKLFGNKNIADSERLFELIKSDLLKRKRGNFLFVKDITTHQRKLLYEMLESKGYKRTELFRHYSY